MRRKDREVTDFARIIEIINGCDCCRIGLIDGDQAYIVPMNFGYEVIDEQIVLYFHCANEGKKLDLLRNQATISFEMDTKHELVEGKTGCSFSYLYQCVMGAGSVSILSGNDEKIHGLQKIIAHYTDRAQLELNDKILAKTTVLELHANTLSCKEH